jgi:hypothetical protein
MKRVSPGLNLKRVLIFKLIAFVAVASVITAVVLASKNRKHAVLRQRALLRLRPRKIQG